MKDLESYASLRYTLMASKNPMIMSYTNAGDSHSVVLNNFRERGLAAAAGADWSKSFYQILTNQSAKGAWPITSATFILMHKVQDKPAQAAAALKFFEWAYKSGDKTAADLDYVPMPDAVKSVIYQSWTQVKDGSGKTIAVK